jgi:hypothetical protein
MDISGRQLRNGGVSAPGCPLSYLASAFPGDMTAISMLIAAQEGKCVPLAVLSTIWY